MAIILMDSSLMRVGTADWRLTIWLSSLEMIKDRPVFGHGINTYMRLFQAYFPQPIAPTYAHNCYVQLAVETGVLGLIGFFFIILRGGKRIIGAMYSDKIVDKNFRQIVMALLVGCFAFLMHSFFDTHFYSLQLSVYFWYIVGMLFAIKKLELNHQS